MVTKLNLLGVYSNFVEYKNYYIVFFSTDVSGLSPKKGFEIKALEFFEMNNLPKETSSATKRRIQEYLSKSYTNSKW